MVVFDLTYVAIFSILFGVTMKLADLTNEHGRKWFLGDSIIFGFLWGGFGSLLILTSNAVANIILAMVIALLIRMRIDYINHTIASVMIIMSFVYFSRLEPIIFLIFFIIFFAFGLLKTYFGDMRNRRDIWFAVNEIMLYYPVPAFIYSVITGDFVVFVIFFLYMIFYNIAKYAGER